ncbi:group 3 secretory phospholipase A2-like [Thalassophryne amazonica]|uniref:group 3 secretory phospholipase A2-like n=1 Tax=Thalassophryne amazonica TaxID=390379 RepID=UPI001471B8CD|nr:group 3 secretory phospholipase A2-like [Thalassophryne amazonica]
MTHAATLLSVIFTSSLLLWTAAGDSILCSWTEVSENETYIIYFVRSDPSASPSLRLYQSLWSAERALLSCTWTDDAGLIQDYNKSACQERTQELKAQQNASFDLEFVFALEEPCESLSSLWGALEEKRLQRADSTLKVKDERSKVSTYVRVKRHFLPPTLWCGPGTMATSYSQLGFFAEADKCCREHDYCKYYIPPYQSAYGVWNSQMFTISHCDCDEKFRKCLIEAKHYVADIMGNLFFNVLKVKCFKPAEKRKAVLQSPACYRFAEEQCHEERSKQKKKWQKKYRH